MTEDGMKLLTKIGKESSLRYSIHLITTANLVSQKRKSAEVDVQDIRKVYSLFVDIKRSVQFLKDFEKEFMFHEADEEGDKMDTSWTWIYILRALSWVLSYVLYI